MSTEADNQPKQKTDIAHEDLTNNALRAHVHGPEMAERHNTAGNGRRNALIAGGLALGLIGGGVVAEEVITNNLAANHQNDGSDIQPSGIQSATAQETSQPSPSSTEVLNTLPPTLSNTQEAHPTKNPNAQLTNEEKLAKSLEIKAGQTPEGLAKSFIALSNEWTNAGCTEATLKESDAQTSITLEEYSTKKATELAKPYIIALYGPDYETNPQAMNYLNSGIKINADVIKLYIMSDPAYNKDVKAHYKQSENFDTIVSSSKTGDTTTVIFDEHFENNSQDAPGVITEVPSGQKLRYTVQFKEVDGVERLTTINSMKL